MSLAMLTPAFRTQQLAVLAKSWKASVNSAARMAAQQSSPSDHPGRRAADRYPLHADVEVLEPWSAHGVVINASDSGLRVALDRELPVGEVCVIEIALEEGKTVEMAKVAWTRALPDGFLAGLAFVRE